MSVSEAWEQYGDGYLKTPMSSVEKNRMRHLQIGEPIGDRADEIGKTRTPFQSQLQDLSRSRTSPSIDHQVHLAMAKVLTTASKCVPNLMVCLGVSLRISFPILLCIGSLVESKPSAVTVCFTYLPNICHSTGPWSFVDLPPIDSIESIYLSRSIVHFGRSCLCRNAMRTTRSFQKRGNASQPKGFFGSLIDDIKEEFGKNKDIKVKQFSTTIDSQKWENLFSCSG